MRVNTIRGAIRRAGSQGDPSRLNATQTAARDLGQELGAEELASAMALEAHRHITAHQELEVVVVIDGPAV